MKLTMFFSSSVNVHGHPSLYVFGKRSVSGKTTYSKEKFFSVKVFFFDIILNFLFRLNCLHDGGNEVSLVLRSKEPFHLLFTQG